MKRVIRRQRWILIALIGLSGAFGITSHHGLGVSGVHSAMVGDSNPPPPHG